MSSIIISNIKDHAFKSSTLTSLSIVAGIVGLLHYFFKRPAKLNLPIIEFAPETRSYDQVVQEGFAKYPDTPFVLATTPPLVFLPASCIDEVKAMPENKASLMVEVKRVFSSNVTDIGEEAHESLPAIKNDLNRHIANVLGSLQEEARYSLDKEFGSCEDWTAQGVYSKITCIVALLSGRVFVGRPLSRDEEWITTTITYTHSCIKARDACDKYPPIIRPIVGSLLREVKDLRAQRQRGAEILKPILDDILDREAKGLVKPEHNTYEDQQGTFCSWMLKYADRKERKNPLRLANNQMGLSFAAVHTTSMALSQVLFDFAARPEYHKALRDELRETIEEDGEQIGEDGGLTLKKSSYTKLKKLDSFMKESQRLSPPEIKVMARMATSDITLSTGHTLPKGTRFCFPSHAIHTSTETTAFSPGYNPPQYTSPLEFDGFRYYKLRQMPGKENKHQFVTTALDSMTFGHGPHACPGRFFANAEIKVVMVELLRNWDVRLKGDVKQEGGVRPSSMIQGFAVIPNMTTEIEFKRLKSPFNL